MSCHYRKQALGLRGTTKVFNGYQAKTTGSNFLILILKSDTSRMGRFSDVVRGL